MNRIVLVSVVGLMCLSGTADAGVRGGKFKGTIEAAIGNSAVATLDFALVGDARTEAQDIGGIVNDYPGTYCEFTIGPFSYWTGTFTGAATYEASGFSFFDVVTTYSLTNNDEPAASGWLWRAGPAEID